VPEEHPTSTIRPLQKKRATSACRHTSAVVVGSFSHPDYTVGFGISPNPPHCAGRGLRRTQGTPSPPVGNFTLPRRTQPDDLVSDDFLKFPEALISLDVLAGQLFLAKSYQTISEHLVLYETRITPNKKKSKEIHSCSLPSNHLKNTSRDTRMSPLPSLSPSFKIGRAPR